MSKKPARRGREGENGETRSVGRPRAKLSDLPENWKGIILALYSEGAADIEVRVALAMPPSHCMSQDLWERFPEKEEALRQRSESCFVVAVKRTTTRGLWLMRRLPYWMKSRKKRRK